MDDSDRVDATSGLPVVRLAGVFFLAVVVFGAGTFVTELAGEIPPDIDAKPFGLVYLLLALVPFGAATLAISLGAAVGEGFLDVREGIEPDDPFGFLGYVVGFVAFAWLLHRVAPSPDNRRWQLLAAAVGAWTQALFEALGFLVMGDGDATMTALTVTGNTLTHGVLFGAIVLLVLYPTVADHRLASSLS